MVRKNFEIWWMPHPFTHWKEYIQFTSLSNFIQNFCISWSAGMLMLFPEEIALSKSTYVTTHALARGPLAHLFPFVNQD